MSLAQGGLSTLLSPADTDSTRSGCAFLATVPGPGRLAAWSEQDGCFDLEAIFKICPSVSLILWMGDTSLRKGKSPIWGNPGSAQKSKATI